MPNFLTVIGIVVFVVSGIMKNKLGMAVGVGLIIIGAFT